MSQYVVPPRNDFSCLSEEPCEDQVPGINLTSEVTGNYKPWMREIEKDTREWEDILCSRVERINILCVLCPYHLKQQANYGLFLSKLQWNFFFLHKYRTNNPKMCMKPQNIPDN